jgi:hypothetical protein
VQLFRLLHSARVKKGTKKEDAETTWISARGNAVSWWSDTLEWCVKLWRLLQKCAREGTKTTAPSSEKFMSETGMMCKCSGCYKVVHKWRNKKMLTDVPWRGMMQMQFLMCFWNLHTCIHNCRQSLHRRPDQFGCPLLVATTLNWIGGDCTILLDAQEEEEEQQQQHEESGRQLLHNSTIQSVVGDCNWNKLFYATNRVEVSKNFRKFAILISLAFVASTLNPPKPQSRARAVQLWRRRRRIRRNFCECQLLQFWNSDSVW